MINSKSYFTLPLVTLSYFFSLRCLAEDTPNLTTLKKSEFVTYKNDKIFIYPNHKWVDLAVTAGLSGAAIGAGCYFLTNNEKVKNIGLIIEIFSGILLTPNAIDLYFSPERNKPMLIISTEGIWHYQHGTIAWSNIEKMSFIKETIGSTKTKYIKLKITTGSSTSKKLISDKYLSVDFKALQSLIADYWNMYYEPQENEKIDQ